MKDSLKPLLEQVWLSFRSPQVLLSVVGIAVALLALTFAAAFLLAPSEAGAGFPTAGLTVVAAPTSTIYVPAPTTTRVPTPTLGIPPSPLPGMIGVGSYVQISGTEGSGLNVRAAAGLSNEVNFLAFDSEVFEVRGGPEVVDGFTWWYLVTPVDESRNGWAASNFLSLVPPPE